MEIIELQLEPTPRVPGAGGCWTHGSSQGAVFTHYLSTYLHIYSPLSRQLWRMAVSTFPPNKLENSIKTTHVPRTCARLHGGKARDARDGWSSVLARRHGWLAGQSVTPGCVLRFCWGEKWGRESGVWSVWSQVFWLQSFHPRPLVSGLHSPWRQVNKNKEGGVVPCAGGGRE